MLQLQQAEQLSNCSHQASTLLLYKPIGCRRQQLQACVQVSATFHISARQYPLVTVHQLPGSCNMQWYCLCWACAGVSHGLDLACRHLSSPGDHIIVEQPTYFLAGSILKQSGLQSVSYPGPFLYACRPPLWGCVFSALLPQPARLPVSCKAGCSGSASSR